ncbi:MAG: hypothetical protein ABSA17_00300 [Rhabdochlamydiaceae bacterium]
MMSVRLDSLNPVSVEKDPNSFSSWSYIASAYMVSVSMGAVLLKIVGYVSSTHIFYCAAGAVTLRLLSEVSIGFAFDAAFTGTTRLGEGSTFPYAGQNYYIAHTLGDGACGAHAILGEKVSGTYQREGVREYYRQELERKLIDPSFREKFNSCLIGLLKDDSTINARAIFGKIEGLVKDLKVEINEIKSNQTRLKAEQSTLFDEALDDANCRPIIDHVLGENKNSPNLHVKISEDLNGIIEALADRDIGNRLSANLSAILESERMLERSYQLFVETDEVFDAYSQTICENYWFTSQEIGLMAHLFEKRVTVFNQLPNGTIQIAAIEGDETHEMVAVFHSGNHYSRCEPV